MMLSAADFRDIFYDSIYESGDDAPERERVRHDGQAGISRSPCLARWEDDGGRTVARDTGPDAAPSPRRVSRGLNPMAVALVGTALPAMVLNAAFTNMFAATFQVWRL